MVIIFSPHILSLNIVCFSVFETKTFKDFSLFNPLTCKNSTPIVAPLYSLGFESILPGMIPLSHKFNLFCYGQMVFKIIFKDFFYLILFKISPPPNCGPTLKFEQFESTLNEDDYSFSALKVIEKIFLIKF